MATQREHEHTLNVWLAAALRRCGLNARQESRQAGGRRIDCEVRIGPVVVAVEAEHGQSPAKRAEAVRDADARIRQELAQCAVAVCYPDGTTEESLPTANLIWTVRDAVAVNAADINPATVSSADWTSGDLEQLAAVIRFTPAQLGDPDSVGAALSSSLDGAVRRLNEGQKRELARALDLPPQTKGSRPVRNSWDAPAKRALLVIATAVMFHSRLDGHRNDLRPEYDNRTNPPEPFTGDWPPMMAQQCAIADDPVGVFAGAWDLLLALDYKPIFETARAALYSCPQDSAFTAAVRDTAAAAVAVGGNIAGQRHDLLGRIFHTVLDTARYDGSFYTTTAAATLLASLAIGEDMCDWQDPAAIASLRITDPACGTGTLLMAAAERIRELAPQFHANAEIGRSLIEDVFTGYDVNLTATHMAATTLGLLSPTTQFRNMKIGRALLGVDDACDAFLGSLEFLDRQPRLMPWPNAGQAVSQVDSGDEMAASEPADLVIMNPPFTRDSLRFDQFSNADEKKMKDREKALFADKPVHLSSNGNTFLVLGEYISKADSGVIAAILPLVTATNVSSLRIRTFLASKYHIETIVTSHDPERIYFSENTNIGEILLICRRWPKHSGPKPATRIVNLAVNPDTPASAISVAWAIANDSVERQNYGTVQEWPEDRIASGNWGAVQFLSPYLCEKFAEISAFEHRGFCPLVSLGKIADIGPAGQGTREMFDRSNMPGSSGMVALWDHKTNVTQSMSARADTHIVAKNGKAVAARRLWERRGTLLLPTRVYLNTVRTIAVRLDTPAVGSAWVPCKLGVSGIDAEVLEKAICVYLNSSVGILALLGNRSNKKPTYPNLSMDDLRKLVVPDFAAIGGDAAAQLAAAYDAHAADVLLPLPQMDGCPVRCALDDAVIAALGLDAEEVATIRRNLSIEPSVTGRRYAGVGAVR